MDVCTPGVYSTYERAASTMSHKVLSPAHFFKTVLQTGHTLMILLVCILHHILWECTSFLFVIVFFSYFVLLSFQNVSLHATYFSLFLTLVLFSSSAFTVPSFTAFIYFTFTLSNLYFRSLCYYFSNFLLDDHW